MRSCSSLPISASRRRETLTGVSFRRFERSYSPRGITMRHNRSSVARGVALEPQPMEVHDERNNAEDRSGAADWLHTRRVRRHGRIPWFIGFGSIHQKGAKHYRLLRLWGLISLYSRRQRSKRAGRRDVQRVGAGPLQPPSQRGGGELRAVVRADVLGYSSDEHHLGQKLDHLLGTDAPFHQDRQALPQVLVDQREQAQHAPIVRPRRHEVVASDVVRLLGSKPHTVAVVEPQPRPGFCFFGTP